MRQLALPLLLALALAGCSTPAPAAGPAPTAGPVAVAGVAPSSAPTAAPTQAPVGVAPTATPQAPHATLAGEFPVEALASLRAKAYRLQDAPVVTAGDLAGLVVTANGQPLAAGTYSFLNVRVSGGKVLFNLVVPVSPTTGQIVSVSNKKKSFSLTLRFAPDVPTTDGEPSLSPESTAIALLRIEQARRGEPTDSPLPKTLVARMADEVTKQLAAGGDRILDQVLADMVKAAADLAATDDVAELERRLHPGGGSSGGSSGGGGSGYVPGLAVAQPKVSLVAIGATQAVVVNGTGGFALAATSADPAIATVTVDPSTYLLTVTAVAPGNTTLSITSSDGRSLSLPVYVTTTSVNIQ